MNIAYHTFKYFNENILSTIPSKWRGRLEFGFRSLSTKPIDTLNENGRSLCKKSKTGETKIYRILRTKFFEKLFTKLIVKLGLVKKNDKVNIDFSEIENRQVLMFGKQTNKGRAIALFFRFIKYPIKIASSQNFFIADAIDEFIKTVQVKIRLVFDRGFAIPFLIKHLIERHEDDVVFYIRIKKSKKLDDKKLSKKISSLKKRDNTINIYEHELRVVRSKKSGKHKEPWFIVTNDFQSTADEIIAIYYHRFEIEEFFKDAKRLSDLEYLRKVNDQSFTIILWFILLGTWVCWLCRQIRRLWRFSRFHRKKGCKLLSLIRFWFCEIAKLKELLFKSFTEV